MHLCVLILTLLGKWKKYRGIIYCAYIALQIPDTHTKNKSPLDIALSESGGELIKGDFVFPGLLCFFMESDGFKF